MAANVETMFYTREKPWHGLGTRVEEAPASADALRLAGLDWQVLQEPIFTDQGEVITGYKANVRDSDRRVLGVVSDVIELSRIRRHSHSRTHCSEAACVTRQQALCRMEEGYGFLHGFQGNISFPVKESRPILYFRIRMMEAVRSRWR